MTSFRLALRVTGASLVGLLALSGCDDGEDDTGSGDTVADTDPGMTDTDPGMTGDSSGGSAESTGDSGSGISHAADIQPIWDANCNQMGCHESGGLFAPDLSDGAAYAAIVGVASPTASLNLIEPESTDNSYLFRKIDGTWMDVDGGTGSMMPLTGMLSDGDLETIRMWIAAGAPE